MGWGDAIMAAGQAQELYDADRSAGPIRLVDSSGQTRGNPIWQYNPAITFECQPEGRTLTTGTGYLPYIRYPYSAETGWTWTGWRARDHRGRVYLSAAERDLAPDEAFILLEPTAERKHPNRRPRRWFWDRLVDVLSVSTRLPIVQLAHPQAESVRRCVQLPNESFRDACGVLSGASVLVTTEGGLPHAAASLDIPAVVLFGGCISAEHLGYPEHVNLSHPGDETPCGRLTECPHCVDGWDRTDPVVVAEHVLRTLEAR